MLKEKAQSEGSESHWLFIIGILTLLAFFVNYISYIFEITDAVVNLFLIPVIIATFLFQKKGMFYTIAIMILYLVFIFVLTQDPLMLLNAGEDVIIMTGIALIITLLSIALHDSVKRYRLLFETSPTPFIVTDPEGKITDINENFEELFGYDKNYLTGLKLQELRFIPEESRSIIRDYAKGIFEGKDTPKSLIVHIEDNNGLNHTCKVFISTLYDEDGNIGMNIIGLLDITDNVLAEKRIKLSLKEKDMLLREVHHRVKNNLQVIVSMLKLQLNRTNDPETRDTLKDCQSRVYSMALVHEKMYRSDSLAIIDIKEYLESLSKDILMEYSDIIGRVTVDVTTEKELSFDLDTIVPCALITNELLTNSLKYAFPGERPGHISIDISGKDMPYRFVYKDDGIGMPPDFDPETTNSLGLKIVRSLVKQLKGDIRINNNAGTEIIITFPIKN